MIVILHNETCLEVATSAKADLEEVFRGHLSVGLASLDKPGDWPEQASYDDLLIYLFDSPGIPELGEQYVQTFLQQRPRTALLLPVALDSRYPVPPGAASKIKALPYGADTFGEKGKLVRRAGAMLGMSLQGRDTRIFISYRATDGTNLARQIFTHLDHLCYKPFRDEAQEGDGYTKIIPGTPVQEKLEEELETSSLLLLLDTPDSESSQWIKKEINLADGMLVPILPVVFRPASDRRRGPRLRSLQALQRYAPVILPDDAAIPALSDAQLDEITDEIEVFLSEIFRRKCRVPFIAERGFRSAGYDWTELSRRLLMFSSVKEVHAKHRLNIYSHCSIFDHIYEPVRKRYTLFLNERPRSNYALLIYDGDLWSDEDAQPYVAEGITVLHHQELGAFIESNFMRIGG